MLTIGICDDDSNIIRKLKNIILESANEQIDIHTYSNGKQLLKEGIRFDILFLDIEMPIINGLELAKLIRKVDTNVKIIYLTYYSEFKDIAFSVHAFAYLIKPMKKEMVQKILKESILYTPSIIDTQYQEVRFLLADGLESFYTNDILYFEFVNRKVTFHTTNNKIFTIHNEKISMIAENMSEYDFCMSHKSFVVNLYHVKLIKGYDITLINGSIIPLSQKYSKIFRAEWDNFLRKIIFQ